MFSWQTSLAKNLKYLIPQKMFIIFLCIYKLKFQWTTKLSSFTYGVQNFSLSVPPPVKSQQHSIPITQVHPFDCVYIYTVQPSNLLNEKWRHSACVFVLGRKTLLRNVNGLLGACVCRLPPAPPRHNKLKASRHLEWWVLHPEPQGDRGVGGLGVDCQKPIADICIMRACVALVELVRTRT